MPFARYVLEHAGRLHFPFRRYQIQKVWRGERPQEGRFREFTQADIDIVDENTLAAHHDIELPLVTLAALERLHVDLGVPPVLMRVSNRILAQGFYAGLDIDDPLPVLRHVDKLDKIGPERVRTLLTDDAGLTAAQADACLALAQISTPDESFVDRVAALGVASPAARRGRRPVRRAGPDRQPERARPDRRRPADRPRAGLLHRHGVRDRAGRLRVLGGDRLRRTLRLARQRRAHHATPGSGSRSG